VGVVKKGDLSLRNHWRGIFIVDIALKMFSSIWVRRLNTLMEEEDMDEQSGFRAYRGTFETSLQKRKNKT
jgi:hypothetical protein